MNESDKITDVALITAYKSGSKKALSILIKRWHIKFCKFAFWYVKDAEIAKDIAQDSWMVIIKKINDLKDLEKFKNWSISIVNRKSIDWIRLQKREKNKLQKFFSEKIIINVNVRENNSTRVKKVLLNSINQLSENQKMVIKLFYLEEYSLQQIGKLLDVSVGTVKSRLFYAREQLKLIIKDRNYEK